MQSVQVDETRLEGEQEVRYAVGGISGAFILDSEYHEAIEHAQQYSSNSIDDISWVAPMNEKDRIAEVIFFRGKRYDLVRQED